MTRTKLLWSSYEDVRVPRTSPPPSSQIAVCDPSSFTGSSATPAAMQLSRGPALCFAALAAEGPSLTCRARPFPALRDSCGSLRPPVSVHCSAPGRLLSFLASSLFLFLFFFLNEEFSLHRMTQFIRSGEEPAIIFTLYLFLPSPLL